MPVRNVAGIRGKPKRIHSPFVEQVAAGELEDKSPQAARRMPARAGVRPIIANSQHLAVRRISVPVDTKKCSMGIPGLSLAVGAALPGSLNHEVDEAALRVG